MRVGSNPSKALSATPGRELDALPEVSVGLLTHAPFLAGYHAEQFDVIRLAVLSAKLRAGQPIHLVVVDNGSCAEVRDWLVSAAADGIIDQLVLNTRNVGKVTAQSQILLGSPGPTVVYADGDLRFHDNWLAPMLAVARAFPEAGIVGGCPVLPGIGDSHGAPDDLGPLAEHTEVEHGRFISPEFARQWLADTGYDDDLDERVADVTSTDVVRLTRDGVSALWGAPHCQFLVAPALRSRLLPTVGRHGLSADEDRAVDDGLAALGAVRLSSADAVFRHVGNRLDDDDRAVLAELSCQPVAAPTSSDETTSWIWSLGPARRAVRAVHHWSFGIINDRTPAERPAWAQRRRNAR